MNKNTELKISNLLKDMGVTPGIVGYDYLRYAVKATMEDPKVIHYVTKRLYPQLCEHFGTTYIRAERGMRHAIEKAWLHGDADLQYKLFRHSRSTTKGKPTVVEFIATVADYLSIVEEDVDGI